MKRAQEPGNNPVFYRVRKFPGKFTDASRNATSGPIKFPDNGPDKLSGPEVTGTSEKRAPGADSAPSHCCFLKRRRIEFEQADDSQIEERSSQLVRNLKSCEKKA